jgi:hypothetical protein
MRVYLYLGLKLTIHVIKSQIHLVRQSLQTKKNAVLRYPVPDTATFPSEDCFILLHRKL